MLAARLLGTVTVPAPAAEPLILTPRPGPSPRINGPKIFGVRPGSPLLFKIPASGERPLRYGAKGLPEGLVVDAATGQITGRLEHPGTHDLVFDVSNAHGTASRPFRIVCGETLALTPHMGWNSWYVWENHVTDKIIRDAADAMVRSRMIDHGYTYVNIDDCWAVKPGAPVSELGGAPRDAEGRVNPNSRFPDMKALAEYIHARGLKAGIYTSPGPLTCGGHVGAYQHEEQDVQRFVEWGYDFLKYNWCSYGQLVKNPGWPGEALQADRRHSQTPAARRRPEPVLVRHGRRLGVGQIGRRPELAHSRRLRRHVRGYSRGPFPRRL